MCRRIEYVTEECTHTYSTLDEPCSEAIKQFNRLSGQSLVSTNSTYSHITSTSTLSADSYQRRRLTISPLELGGYDKPLPPRPDSGFPDTAFGLCGQPTSLSRIFEKAFCLRCRRETWLVSSWNGERMHRQSPAGRTASWQRLKGTVDLQRESVVGSVSGRSERGSGGGNVWKMREMDEELGRAVMAIENLLLPGES